MLIYLEWLGIVALTGVVLFLILALFFIVIIAIREVTRGNKKD